MACARLLDPGNETHEFWHDLESFFHVYLYHAILYQASRIPPAPGLSERIFQQLEEHFDSSRSRIDAPDEGGQSKADLFQLSTRRFKEGDLSKFLNKTLRGSIFDLRNLFLPLYVERDAQTEMFLELISSVEVAQDRLKSSKPLTDIFRSGLEKEGWTNDGSDGLFGKPPVNKQIIRAAKRKGKDSELDNKPKQKKKSRVSQDASEIVVSSLVLGSSSIDEESDIFDS